jgi:succinate dehydrogenase / fumarate reductase, cytochrome b subunit
MQKSYESTHSAPALPRAFIWRRLHSLTGLFLVLFLFEHLLVNSQAALFVGDDGAGFVSAVNTIKSLPYLPVIELTLLGFPILLHGWFGIQYLFSAKPNSFQTDGSAPALSRYSRNHAYTWQRITALVLVVGLTLHVGYMRFLKKPIEADLGQHTEYMVKLSMDPGLYTLSDRLGFQLYDHQTIAEEDGRMIEEIKAFKVRESTLKIEAVKSPVNLEEEHFLQREQAFSLKEKRMRALKETSLIDNEVMAVTTSFGCAELIMVRDAFKSIWICTLYTLFVLAACFHAMNGVWSFAIAWGITLTERSRQITRKVSDSIMLLIVFFGLAAIWGTYWINLKN